MIAIELIIAAFFIGKIYKIKPIEELPTWITIIFIVALSMVSIDNKFKYIRKIEALEKLAIEISKNKVEEK